MNVTTDANISLTINLLQNGHGIRAVRRKTGLHTNTIRRIKSDYRIISPPCKCGQPTGHQGWCSYRYANSPARKRFMEIWHYDHRHWRIRPKYRRGGRFYRRQDTYKSYGHERRAFYKWICKRELFGNMRLFKDKWGTYYMRESPKYTFGYTFRRGYPAFDATRSEARDQWEAEAYPHFHALAAKQSREYQQQIRDKVDQLEWAAVAKRMSKNVTFFRVLAGAPRVLGSGK